ncbi:MAG: hypothetical protein U1A78_19105 [Polyangia bacterium]
MSRKQDSSDAWVIGAAVGGTALVGGILLAVAAWPRPASTPGPTVTPRRPSDDWQTAPSYTEADVEAAARMLASESARGSRALHIELIHSQLRARKKGQALFDRITAGSGWGPQGERAAGGGVRPVSTEEPATPALRQLAREVLDGAHPSVLPGARKFFEPAQQDRAFAVAERARQKQAAGRPLSKNEQRLLGYLRTAQQVRREWLADGARYIGRADGFEFYT